MVKKWIAIIAAIAFCALLVYSMVEVWKERFEPAFGTTIDMADPELAIANLDNRYFLSAMDEQTLSAACLLYNAMMEFKPECMMPQGIHAERMGDILGILYAECPELFQVDFFGITYQYYTGSNDVFRVYIPYYFESYRYEVMREECDAVLRLMASETSGMTNLEKEKYVFDYLAMKCCYDEAADYSATAYGALVSGRAKCDGISLAMKWCMEAVDVPCVCLIGDPLTGDVGHAWNMVCIDGAYYNVDLTASVRHDQMEYPLSKMIVYSLFNVSDHWFSEQYAVRDCFDSIAQKPVCPDDTQSYFYLQGTYLPAGTSAETVLATVFALLDENDECWLQIADRDAFAVFCEQFPQEAENWLSSQDNDRLTIQWQAFGGNVVWIKLLGSYA